MLKKRIWIAAGILIVLLLASVTSSWWLPHSPTHIEATQRLHGISAHNWFGTDHFGRDVFARTIAAAKVSFFIGMAVAFIATVLGTLVGLVSGYYRKVDFIIMRIIDGMMAFPALLLALALVAALGGSMTNIIIALTFANFPQMTRVIRSAVLKVKQLQFIEAAVTTGTGPFTILFRYVLPNVSSPIIVQATFTFAKAILAEAALSFLGLGISPSIPTWGNMLQEAQEYITIAPWLSIFPGIAIVITVLSLNILGDGLRDLLDPHRTKTMQPLKRKTQLKRAKTESTKQEVI
ncbi:ABC transporter permease [Sporolactobacillus terrae]|uniref:ABC transporter permease n=1 Tax=Sporolactobacillus terrae TaxID=269673 RepID=UPI0006871303|nr:ABC transporter permease [Sporolactobacillus terrae]